MGRKQRRRREEKELDRATVAARPWLGAGDIARMAANMAVFAQPPQM